MGKVEDGLLGGLNLGEFLGPRLGAAHEHPDGLAPRLKRKSAGRC
jgi:hypothetical protein